MNWTDAFARVPPLLVAHIEISLAALLLALAVALPLAIWARHNSMVARAALGFASLVQTIPGLALLALFYPLLVGVRALLGDWVSPLGFLPSLLALFLYALLPILRNAIIGLQSVDPAMIEAARGLGMDARQRLALVEAPLAAPTIMAGIRTAAVWTIGAATLATTIGQPSLGDLIFAGLQTQNWALVLAGCAASAGLALIVDALLGVVARGIAEWDRRWRRLSLWAALAVLAAGLSLAMLPRLIPDRGAVLTVGAKGFGEQYILSRLIGARLEAAGYRVRYRDGLGSAVVFRALDDGEIDVYVDYAGTLWTNEMQRRGTPDRERMMAGISQWLKRETNVRSLGPLGFENAYAFAMRGDDARALGVASLADLARVSRRLTFATDPEFLERPEWAAVRAAYPIRFAAVRSVSPTLMYQALAGRQADVITAYSSDGRVAADGLTVLTDPKQAIPGYDALLLLSDDAVADADVVAALKPLVGAIDVATMRRANYMVDRAANKASPAEAAAWLAEQIGAQ